MVRRACAPGVMRRPAAATSPCVTRHDAARAVFTHHPADMTRSDLVILLAERFGQLTQRDTEFAVKTILDAMSDALARGHRIEIRGFGSFSISRRPPRVGRNPRSGEQVTIPEKLVPHFKPGKALREAVDARGAPRDDTPAKAP
jgi:integration host factor subunit beta